AIAAVLVGVDRVRHARRRKSAVGGGARLTGALADVPPVISAGLGIVHFLPIRLPDVVDEKTRPDRVWVERDPERIPEPTREGFLALVVRARPAVDVAPRRSSALKRVRGRYVAVAGDPQDLPEQDELIARCVVRRATAAVVCVVTSTVAHADVQVAVLPELHVAAVVVAAISGNVVDQDLFAFGVDDVVVTEFESRDAVDRARAAGKFAAVELVEGVVDVDEVVAREERVDRDAQHS